MLFLLDEFAALGRLEPVERAMGLMAGYGLQLWPILQDLNQLRATYGDKAGTSEKTGILLSSDHSRSTSTHVAARSLMNPDEIMRMPLDQQLLLLQGQDPLMVEKVRYYDGREFAGLADPA